MYRSRCILLATVFVFSVVSTALANDWPQWMGPDRTGVSKETGLLKTWPKTGPKLKWKAKDLGEGYSAPAVAGNRVYLLGKADTSETVVALDENDGTQLWSVKIGKVGKNPTSKGNYWPGPRGTPTVVGDKLYALGSDGDLVCLDVAKGESVWKKRLPTDFGGKPGNWAYAESPLVDGDKVIVSPGGKTATVVALDKSDGKLLWQAPLGDNAAYGSPIRIEVGGVKQYVVFLSKGLAGLAVEDGKLLWRFEKPGSKNGINIPTPVFHDNQIFGVSGYDTGGAGMATLKADKGAVTATEAWFDKKLVSKVGGFVCVGNHLYGTAGSRGNLMCLEFATGKVVWDDPCVGAASVCAVGGKLYVRGHNGTVVLVDATPAGYRESGRFKQPDRSENPAWPYPVVANGGFYLRDQEVLLCYDVQANKK
jgi:outer membrane protein assembly factor BamB